MIQGRYLTKSNEETPTARVSKIVPLAPAAPPSIPATGTLLLDPSLGSRQFADIVDTLSLITDTIIIVDPSHQNLLNWKYDSRRFAKLVDHRLFLPIFPSTNDNPFSTGISRQNLLADPDFFASYEIAIQHDLEDDIFVALAERLDLNPNDLAFNVNWDLIIAQLLGSPLMTPPPLLPVWQHKLQTSIRDLSAIATLPPEAKNAHVLTRFLHRVLNDLPSSLTTDQLLEFRKDDRSANFRKWFREQLEKGATSTHTSSLTLDDTIYRDFKNLAHAYARKAKTVSGTLTTLSSIAGTVIGAILGNVPGAVIGGLAPLASYPFQNTLHRVWRKRSPHNWVFVLMDIRSTTQL